MRIRWASELNGRQGMVADPEGYDGVPWLRELWMDRSPVAFHNDRFAVAAALVFGRYVASRFEFENAVSPGVSESIKTFCANPGLNVAPIEYHQKLFPTGDGVLNVVSNDYAAMANHGVADDRHVVLNVLRSDLYSGSLLSMTSLAVASNAFLHDADNIDESCNLAELAVGVLFAEDLGLDCLKVSGSEISDGISGMLTAAGLRTA